MAILEWIFPGTVEATKPRAPQEKDTFYPQLLEIPKIKGFTEDEILFDWLRFRLPEGHFVLLKNIDPSAKSEAYWASMPLGAAIELSKDFVLLRCKNRDEMVGIVDSSDFSDAYGFKDGELIY